MNRLCLILMATLMAAGVANAEWGFTDVTAAQMADRPAEATVVAWGDVDKDGDPDLFVGGNSEMRSRLYLNNGGNFVNAANLYELPGTLNVRKAQFLDYDRDGYLDLFILSDESESVKLYRQLHNRRFSENLFAGMQFAEAVRGCAWADINGDGTLDLVLTNGPTVGSPMMFLSQEGNEFVEMRDDPFAESLTHVGAISIADYDFDGDEDVFLGDRSGSIQARLYINNGGDYDNWSPRFGFQPKQGRTGACWLDFNNDQQLDLFLPGVEGNAALFRGMPRYGVAGFKDVGWMEGLFPAADNTVYAQPVDANMDGWTDLFLVRADDEGCRLLINMDGRQWRDETVRLRLQDNFCADCDVPIRSGSWADYDGDGDLDLVLALGTSGIMVLRNDLSIPREYITLRLRSSNTRTPVLNCNVQMTFENAKRVAVSQLGTVTPGMDGSDITLVNPSDRKSGFARLVVQWPNGTTRTYNRDKLNLGGITELYMPLTPEDPIQMERPAGPLVQNPTDLRIGPNPFNPTTSLTFTLPEAADVELRVYNLTGQEVATLAAGRHAEGPHSVTFDAGALPSGLYFARLSVGQVTATHRMLLMK